MTRLSPAASRFIQRENAYLRTRSRAAAQLFLADLTSVGQLLDDYPLAGTELTLLRGTAREGLRRWVKGNYTFDYRVAPDQEAYIVLIRHHAQHDPHQAFVPDDIGEDFD